MPVWRGFGLGMTNQAWKPKEQTSKEQKLVLPEEGTKWPWEALTFFCDGCYQSTNHINSQHGRCKTESLDTNQRPSSCRRRPCFGAFSSHALSSPGFHSLQPLDWGKEVSWFSFALKPTERNKELSKANQNFAAPKPLAPSYEGMVLRFIKALQGTITSICATECGLPAPHHSMWMPPILY